ncbi:MAG TPA: DUF1932 domain-containing protein [Anaerolineae bacterium]|nr:DUF1932 domain-containing protein [Anaerolineae bacterium]
MAHKIAILHPGAMGVSIAASAINSGQEVYWASEGRSAATHARAAQCNLRDAGTLANLCAICNVVISVCPPHAAEEVARQVIANKFRGLYLDANAISPQRAIRLGAMLHEVGIEFVDGGIIGGPAWRAGETRLWLSGERAAEIAECFAAGPLETRVMGQEIGKASALKMCYAAYTKGTTALLAAILAASEELDVRAELYEEWSYEDANFTKKTEERVRRVTAKAWRFEGEMNEIAATFQEAGLPNEFHQAAAEIYRRVAFMKDLQESPSLDQVFAALNLKERTTSRK